MMKLLPIRLILFILFLILGSSVLATSCPANFDKVGTRCYRFYTVGRKPFPEAEAHCRYVGGMLAEQDTEQKKNEVVKFIQNKRIATTGGRDQLWIGASDMLRESHFTWTHSGTRVDMSRSAWYGSNPDGGRNENCMTVKGLKWNDVPCTIRLRFICQLLPGEGETCDNNLCASDLQCIHNTCLCPSVHQYYAEIWKSTPRKCELRKTKGQNCNMNQGKCDTTSGLQCIQNLCSCPSDKFYNEINRKCEQVLTTSGIILTGNKIEEGTPWSILAKLTVTPEDRKNVYQRRAFVYFNTKYEICVGMNLDECPPSELPTGYYICYCSGRTNNAYDLNVTFVAKVWQSQGNISLKLNALNPSDAPIVKHVGTLPIIEGKKQKVKSSAKKPVTNYIIGILWTVCVLLL